MQKPSKVSDDPDEKKKAPKFRLPFSIPTGIDYAKSAASKARIPLLILDSLKEMLLVR